jgi:hypothetical protein
MKEARLAPNMKAMKMRNAREAIYKVLLVFGVFVWVVVRVWNVLVNGYIFGVFFR